MRECEYYKEFDKDNDKPYAYYRLKTNWKTKNIINDKCLDGYIVQKVKISNNTGISGIDNKEYYEAWKVVNGECEKSKKHDYDDKFANEEDEDDEILTNKFAIIIANSIGKAGEIKYSSEIFWISKQHDLYKIVDEWQVGCVPESGNLKSILVVECKKFNEYKLEPICKRDDFIHRVNFVNEKIITENIQNLALELKNSGEFGKINCLKEELEDVYNFLPKVKYRSVVKNIINNLDSMCNMVELEN